MKVFFLILLVLCSFLPSFSSHVSSDELDGPQLYDQSLVVERFVKEGIPNSPTTMTFVGDDILVLERYTGLVRLVRDGQLQPWPVLDVSVAKDGERGMLGITAIGNTVYLYFTAAEVDAGQAIENRIYKYTWNGDNLVEPVLIKILPSDNFYHNGGAMTNHNGQVYAIIGDNGNYGILQNRPHEWKNDTSVILRVDPPGSYYAIGIRNSFGIAVDPITGNLWDTENGPDEYDEINLVPENFNSGWIEIMGPANNQTKVDALPKYGDFAYSDPEFSWQKPVAPTGIEFGTEQLGHPDKIFASDCNTGSLYWFTLNSQRNGLTFNSPELNDLVLNTDESNAEIVLGNGFGCATDIERGPDGFLYIVSLSDGAIYRIMPAAPIKQDIVDSPQSGPETDMLAQYIAIGIGALGAVIVGFAIKRKRQKTLQR